jgi:hypothetical protein
MGPVNRWAMPGRRLVYNDVGVAPGWYESGLWPLNWHPIGFLMAVPTVSSVGYSQGSAGAIFIYSATFCFTIGYPFSSHKTRPPSSTLTFSLL